MSELGPRLKKLQQAYEEIEAKRRPVECIWQIVRRDSELVQDLEAFSPVSRSRGPAKLPDDEEGRITLLNEGKVLLLDGVLRLFVIPDEMDLAKVETLFDRMSCRYGTNRSALYSAAAKILYNTKE